MAHRIDYSGNGTRARVQIDLNGASLDSDANPIGSQWQTLQNVLTHLPGVLQKRGAIVDAGGNSTDINDTVGALAFYDGPETGGTYRAYVGVCADGANTEIFLQTEATSRFEAISGSGLYPTMLSKLPTVANNLIICGAGGVADPADVPGLALLYGGSGYTAATTYIVGTATFTVGSTTVTGSGTTWTAAMEGMYCKNDADSASRVSSWYRIAKRISNTEVQLDRPYNGDSAGAGKSYTFQNVVTHNLAAASPFGVSDNTNARYRFAAGAWNRLLVAGTQEGGVASSGGTSAPRYLTRLRWGATLGSDEGPNDAAAGTVYGFDPNGFIDLFDRFGEIVAAPVPWRDAVLVFQQSGVTVLRGAPVYDGAGSLDASEVHPGVVINGGFAFEATSEGVFFFDKNIGPCVYDGSSVQRIGDARVTRTMMPYGITAVGYYDGKALFSGSTLPGTFVFDTRTQQWSLQTAPAYVSCLIPGRVENNEDVVGLGAGKQVVNLANMFDAPGVAATDWTGGVIGVDIKTGKIGDALTMLRPERMYVTYRLTDLSTTNPYLTATVTTGLPDTSNAEHTYANASTALAETTDVETKVLEIEMDRDPMMQLRLLQVNGAGKLEIYSVVIDCSVEGEGPSSL